MSLTNVHVLKNLVMLCLRKKLIKNSAQTDLIFRFNEFIIFLILIGLK